MLKTLYFSTTLALGVCAFAGMNPAHAQDWQYNLGAGVGYVQSYEGSDDYEAKFIPVVKADYKDGLFFADFRDGIGSYPIRGENYRVGASVGYKGGRDESDDRDNLNGMGDVDESATANVMAEYTIGSMAQLSGKVTTALTGDYGTTVDVKLGSRYPVSNHVSLTGSVGTQWADSEHMSNYFGVTTTQSGRSGYAAHDAGSGIKSVGATVGVTYSVTDQWSTNLTLHGHQLLGDAANSPIVKDEFVPAVFLTTSYRF